MRALGAWLVLSALSAPASGASAQAQARPAADVVRVDSGLLTLETYDEGVPNVNPPFDLFSARVNYPYTLRDNLTDRHAPRPWRALTLENRYLRCTVLPDLGGHLYTCIDKVNGASLFYANPSIKKANVAYRGAWTALGIEFNFPVSHNWLTVSPVDFRTTRGTDGSATIWVGNIDRVYGGEWRVALTLRPGEARLEQRTWLYNRSPLRHRFYWWTNAAVEAWDDTRLAYPMSFTAGHGFSDIDTWPTSAAGVDLSLVGNHTFGPVSRFSYGSREPFMAVYHPRTQAGVAHYASPTDLPSKKVWSWGSDADGLDWRKALSDNNSAYVEVQAGLFRNQETYAFLDPESAISFVEYWLPVRAIGGVTRATSELVLHLERPSSTPGALAAGLNVAVPIAGATIALECGATYQRREERVSLSPARVWTRRYEQLPEAPCTFTVRDAAGRIRLTQTEGVRDEVARSDVRLGPQERPAAGAPGARSDGEVRSLGAQLELEGKRLAAWEVYRDGLARFPASGALHKAAGRLAVALKRDEEAAAHLDRALADISNDPEAHYYAGIAQTRLGRLRAAREHFELAQQFVGYRAAARLELAGLSARAGALEEALAHVRVALQAAPESVRAGHAEAVLLRALSRGPEARAALARWQAIAPLDNALRVEAARQGSVDAELASHLAGDPERVIEVAIAYMRLGRWADAVTLLGQPFPADARVFAEPGMPAPAAYPLVAYYRGYCRRQLGEPGDADYAAASRQSTTYVFPNRPETVVVLRDALQVHGDDATARFLLGSLHLSGGDTEAAVADWEAVRRAQPRLPVLHRNLGLTLLQTGAERRAVEVLTEGLAIDPRNVELYLGLDSALAMTGASAADRVRALERHPDRAAMPSTLAFRLAVAYAEAARFDEARALFAGRFFAREEGGTNVRQVYLIVRLREAAALARGGQCADAGTMLDRLATPVDRLAFTRDGLEPLLRDRRVAYEIGSVRAACGDTAGAAAQWTALKARTGGSLLDTVFSWMAARRAGGPEPPRAPLEQLLAESQRQIDATGSGVSGTLLAARALAFAALGRPEEARQAALATLRAPDARLSHLLARDVLAGVYAR